MSDQQWIAESGKQWNLMRQRRWWWSSGSLLRAVQSMDMRDAVFAHKRAVWVQRAWYSLERACIDKEILGVRVIGRQLVELLYAR